MQYNFKHKQKTKEKPHLERSCIFDFPIFLGYYENTKTIFHGFYHCLLKLFHIKLGQCSKLGKTLIHPKNSVIMGSGGKVFKSTIFLGDFSYKERQLLLVGFLYLTIVRSYFLSTSKRSNRNCFVIQNHESSETFWQHIARGMSQQMKVISFQMKICHITQRQVCFLSRKE